MKKSLLLVSGLILLMGVMSFALAVEAKAGEKLRIGGVYTVPVEEPFINAVHQACLRAVKELNVEFEFTENVSAADHERVQREYSERGFDIIMVDAYGRDRISRKAAKDYPKIAFLGASDLGPANPNFSVFTSWIHEPVYLCGMIAGKLTKTNIIGWVGGMVIPLSARNLNAFNMGAREVNPNVKILGSFIGTFFDPPKAKEAAFAQLAAGADILLADRYGVIEACQQKKALAFGHFVDQHSLGPETVITGSVWDAWPTIKKIVSDVRGGHYEAMDYRDWNMMIKGGAYLAPFYNFEQKLPKDILEMVKKRTDEILAGTFRVPINEETPRSD